MKTVLLIGAAGLLGRNLLSELAGDFKYIVTASDMDKSKIQDLSNIKRISNEELLAMKPCRFEVIINCAFARGNNSQELVDALYFNEKLIQKIKEFEIGTIINISSQGLYKSRKQGDLANEKAEIEPRDLYSMGKFAQERLFTSNFCSKVTNIRMASLCTNAGFVLFFVNQVIAGEDIVVTAPNQYVSLLDVQDAAEGICKIADIADGKRRNVYNLGNGKQYSILQIAEIIKSIGSKYGYNKTKIVINDSGKCSAAGMDVSALCQDTGWKAKTEVEEMIDQLFLQKMQ